MAYATYLALKKIITMPRIIKTGALTATPKPNKKLPATTSAIVFTD
jgi:hypothetical protein